MADLVDWFHYITRRGPFWGYYRYDMKYDPMFQLRVELTDRLSPAYPFGYLHWEGIEKVNNNLLFYINVYVLLV